jgi:NADPH-dependent ferric siderophore reductase
MSDTDPLNPALHRGRVIRRRSVTPHMVRLTIAEIVPAEGSPPSFGEHADEFFTLVVPDSARDGGEPAHRYYTVRAWRPEVGEFDVDLLLHGRGPATEWAARARVGDVVSFDDPSGHYRPPSDAEWIGLCGDATALPAIGRIMQERDEEADAGASAPVHLVLHVDDPVDRQNFPLRDGDTVQWVDAEGLVPQTLALIDVHAASDVPGYLWFSGEAGDMRKVRHRLRRELRQPTERWMTMGYWRRDRERWLARYEAAGEAFHRQLEEVWSSADDDATQTDRAEELLAERGLL